MLNINEKYILYIYFEELVTQDIAYPWVNFIMGVGHTNQADK